MRCSEDAESHDARAGALPGGFPAAGNQGQKRARHGRPHSDRIMIHWAAKTGERRAALAGPAAIADG